MPAGQTTPTTPIYGATITTVDPTQNLVQAVFKGDNQARGVSVYTTPVAFRWPVVGEAWMCKQVNNTWYLDSPWPAVNSTTSFTDISPGDVILNTPTGVVHVIGSSDTPPLDYALYPPVAWAELPYAPSWEDYGSPWQDGQYSFNSLGDCLLRGVIKKATPWVLGETIATIPTEIEAIGPKTITCAGLDASGIYIVVTLTIETSGEIVLTQTVPTIGTPEDMSILILSGIGPPTQLALPPSGTAGGVLSGTYPNPGFAASPAFTGVPTAPTAAALTSTTQIATTAFTTSAVAIETARAEAAEAAAITTAETFATGAVTTETTRAEAAEALKAPLASPALTGTPTVPTAAPGTSTTQAASTAFVTAVTAVETARAEAAEAGIPGLVNLVTNPSFEYDTLGGAPAGWADGTGGSIVAFSVIPSSTWAKSGTKSLQLAASGVPASGGDVYALLPNFAAIANAPYSGQATFNVQTANTTPTIQVYWYTSALAFISAATVAGTATATVQTLQFVNQLAPSNAAFGAVFLALWNGTAGAITCNAYLDAILLVQSATLPTYFDGDTPGYHWAGVPGNSISQIGGVLGLANSLLQNGVVNAGDGWLTAVSVNGSTCALTLSLAAANPMYALSSGVIVPVNFSGVSNGVYTPATLPSSGTTTVQGVEIDTAGVVHLVGAGLSGGNLPLSSFTSPAVTAGRVRIADVAVANVGGTYELAVTNYVVQGPAGNYLDRRPWARGASSLIRFFTTGYAYSGSGNTPLDSTNLSLRMEFSGVPVEVKFIGTYSTSAGNVGVYLPLGIDGSVFSTYPEYVPTALAGCQRSFCATYQFTPTKGSHLIQPLTCNTGGAWTLNIYGYVEDYILLSVQEIVRQNSGNGTT